MRKIYVSTPVNARPEGCFEAKYKAAARRARKVARDFAAATGENPEFIFFFDLAALGRNTEAEAMGKCIQGVIESDALLLDDTCQEADWKHSKGCRTEVFAARQYGKSVILASEVTRDR